MRNVRRPRQIKLAAIAAVVAITPVLSSCSLSGFDYATDRPNDIINGGTGSAGDVHVLAARIVAPADGHGTFVSTITTNEGADEASLVGLSGIITSTVQPIEVPSGGRVNLFTDGGIGVSGDFVAGDVVPVTLTFQTGSDTTDVAVNAVVVTQCHEYEDVAGGKAAKLKALAAGEAPYDCDYATSDLPDNE